MIKASQLVGCLLSSLLCVEVAFAQDPSAGQVTIPGYSPNAAPTQSQQYTGFGNGNQNGNNKSNSKSGSNWNIQY